MPNRLKLTQAALERLRPPTDKAITHWDQALRGFGVRVSPQGRKTFLAQYRIKGGKEVVETFGTADKITLIEAQKQARASFVLAREGIHPVEQRKQKQAAIQASAEQQAFTFERLAERYMQEYVLLNNRPSTAREARRSLMRAVRSFGAKPANAITRDDIVDLLAAYRASKAGGRAATNGLVEANSLLGSLQRCFKWARRQRLIEVDPTFDIPKPLKNVPTRDHVLRDAEIIAFWEGCNRIGWPFGPVFKLLLLTGQRLNEVAGMRWTEVELGERKWTIPVARAKNKRQHEVALNDLAMEILEGLPSFGGIGSDFVFPAMKGVADKPVIGFSYAKKNVAEYMAAPPWRLHDLRRTATTGMARLRVPHEVADKVLNHQSGAISGVKLIYNRFEYLDDRRDALCLWGRFVEELVHPERARRDGIEIEREVDGRWSAALDALPGVVIYGATEMEARARATLLAQRLAPASPGAAAA